MILELLLLLQLLWLPWGIENDRKDAIERLLGSMAFLRVEQQSLYSWRGDLGFYEIARFPHRVTVLPPLQQIEAYYLASGDRWDTQPVSDETRQAGGLFLTGGGIRAFARADYDISQVFSDCVVAGTVRELIAKYCEVSDDQLAMLESMRSLRKLDLSSTSVTDGGLVHVPPCVTHLVLSDTDVRGHGLFQLPCRERIVSLVLGGCSLDAEAADAIAAMPRLRELRLHKSTVDDEFIAKLPADSPLEIIDLVDTKITNASLDHMARFPYLRELCLAGTYVDSDGLSKFVKAVDLKLVVADQHQIAEDLAERVKDDPTITLVLRDAERDQLDPELLRQLFERIQRQID